MQKNVAVVDETGQALSPTWAKRARGLVKTGRAEYLDDATIRLLPENGEEPVMSNENTAPVVPSMEYVLDRLDKIINEKDYFFAACATMEKIPNDANAPARAAAIEGMVKEREETNRKALDLLNKMYEDAKLGQ